MDVGLGDVVGARRRARSAVPGVFTSALLRELRLPVGASGSLPVAGVDVPIVVAREVPALPATDGQPRAALLDLPALANYLEHDGEPPLTPDEWWIATTPAGHAAAAEAARGLAGVTVLDRTGIADAARTDPYWTGARRDLLLVAAASMLLALVGMALDARVVGRRRRGENAVLAALGASGGVLARAVIVERLLLTVVGVLVGVATGVVGAAILGGGMIRSSSGESPFPAPPLVVPGLELAVLTVGTLTAAVAVSRLLGVGASATPRGDA
jgi:hypothetical protein